MPFLKTLTHMGYLGVQNQRHPTPTVDPLESVEPILRSRNIHPPPIAKHHRSLHCILRRKGRGFSRCQCREHCMGHWYSLAPVAALVYARVQNQKQQSSAGSRKQLFPITTQKEGTHLWTHPCTHCLVGLDNASFQFIQRLLSLHISIYSIYIYIYIIYIYTYVGTHFGRLLVIFHKL